MTPTYPYPGQPSRWKKATVQAFLVLGGCLLIGLAARISVPTYPVPVTLQTLAILLVGLTYGARLGALTLCVYLLQGALGIPVFAPTTLPGLAAFAGPTAGFLVGFVAMAWAAGWVGDTIPGRGVRAMIVRSALAIAITVLLYVPGVMWPWGVAGALGMQAAWVGGALGQLYAGWVAPFVVWDALKAVVAVLLASGVRYALSDMRIGSRR